MTSNYFLYEKDKEKRIGWITFNRPERLNYMEVEDMRSFTPLLSEIENDDDVKVLVLKGAGKAFGTGMDVMGLGTQTVGITRDTNVPRPSVHRRLLNDRRIMHTHIDDFGLAAVSHFMKPVIAQVHGYCYGWHFQVVSTVDMIVASEEALFTHPAFRYICEPQPGMSWMYTLGANRTAEALFTGRAFTSAELERCGMVNKVVPYKRLEDEVKEIASIIALQPLDTLMVTKHYLETLKAMRHESYSSHLVGVMAHTLSSYYKVESGDYSILRETSKLGASGAIQAREDRYPPKYRLSHKGRGEEEV